VSLTLWHYRGTGHKFLSSLKAPDLTVKQWPGGIIDGDGTGYGIMNGAHECRNATLAHGYHYLYSDGPFFLARKPNSVRLVWDAFLWHGQGPDRDADLDAAGCVIRPWAQGDDILVTPCSPIWHTSQMKEPVEKWVERTVTEIRQHTDRPITVRYKPNGGLDIKRRTRGMEKALAKAWAVVSGYSTFPIEAICRGVPAFTTVPGVTLKLAGSDLSQIENPPLPSEDERRAWAKNIAARQFTVAELGNGKAWRVCAEDLQHMKEVA